MSLVQGRVRYVLILAMSPVVLMKDAELTGMPMKDFFDCTTSPSGILAAEKYTIGATSAIEDLEWSGECETRSRRYVDG